MIKYILLTFFIFIFNVKPQQQNPEIASQVVLPVTIDTIEEDIVQVLQKNEFHRLPSLKAQLIQIRQKYVQSFTIYKQANKKPEYTLAIARIDSALAFIDQAERNALRTEKINTLTNEYTYTEEFYNKNLKEQKKLEDKVENLRKKLSTKTTSNANVLELQSKITNLQKELSQLEDQKNFFKKILNALNQLL